MNLGKFGDLVGAVAPTIATALGGPLAGMAVKAISSALLGHGDGSEDDINAALANATPDQITALKKIDADFKVQMKSLDIDLEQLAVQDRDSARQMQIQVHDWIPRALSICVTVGFFGILFYIIRYGLPTSGSEALLMMLGALGTAWTGVMSFYFGSSAGSQRKDNTIHQALNGK
jgi:hypothetical protein